MQWKFQIKEPSHSQQLFMVCKQEKLRRGYVSKFYMALQVDLKNKDLESEEG